VSTLKASSRLSQATGWRMIVATALTAIICWLVVLVMLRGVVAQNAEPVGTETNEEEVVSRRVLPQTEREADAPEFRESADNNISFPVDI
jgi:uncharacterized membrane protein YdfJ with MMPL/SSD domain